jgi:alkylhydroperoxidase/carboxymuconolactone decarboxylase family protein YurZ
VTESSDKYARFNRGLDMMQKVYGPSIKPMIEPLRDVPFPSKTAEILFGEIWSRPQLSIRDRRLLVIGATAMLGRADLIEQQVAGALVNKELTAEQLEEAVLQLWFYTGAGNATAVWRGVQAALKAHAGGDPR